MKRVVVLSLVVIAGGAGLLATSSSAVPALGKAVTIAERERPVRIVCQPSADVREMGYYLQRFLKDRGLAVSPGLATTAAKGYAGPQWILAIDPGRFAASARDEAFRLSVSGGDGAASVALTGKTASGLRAAVARLLGKCANHGKTLSIPAGTEQVDPFIKLRLMNIGQAARRQAPPGSPFEDANYETWDAKRIRAYPEMVWHLGFNGVQVDECRGYGSVKDDELVRVRKAVQNVSRGAHDWHLYVSFSQWGDVPYDEGITYCWNDPRQRQDLLRFIDGLARDYAPYVDNVTCRFCDPGGCTSNGCDLYKTPQVITSEYLKAFRKFNPEISATLSLWANVAFWHVCPTRVDLTNYSHYFRDPNSSIFGQPVPGGAGFLDETYMPKSVGIALHRYYNADQARVITESGRAVDIKGWYVGDMEMNDNLCINVSDVDNQFSAIPEDARDRVRMQTVEMCFHGWPQVINHYVAAQKLIDPSRSLDTLMREFCTAAFGPQNADAMVDLYRACENGINHAIPQPADFGTSAYNARMRSVMKKADAVKLAPGWRPNFAFPVPVQKYLDMLRARLRLTLAVSEAKEAVDAARSRLGLKKADGARSIHIDVQDSNGQNVISTGGRDIEMSTQVKKGGTIGQTFTAPVDFERVGVLCTRWGGGQAGCKIALYDSPGGNLLMYAIEQSLPDGEHFWLNGHRPAGKYYLELSDPTGDKIGVYNSSNACPGGGLMANRQPVGGEPEEIRRIKSEALSNLPDLPIDPIYRQDPSVVVPFFRTATYAEMIENL